ncbi:hypothetical protein DFJ58DRAFT_838264 [Suillus subalutaceus]|uniref:uncharacterized protein n=1 Tax=Suillus subalutaceus TaxID=48586 RepID=UPI001B867D1A|nr:uncharacterized protein DFJ58DRAFT_838264 [Suillus subalutaceus]KAG1867280.1 hypothetical protein DFJ58DRAFT_838264 [Suillus subalutaceus]
MSVICEVKPEAEEALDSELDANNPSPVNITLLGLALPDPSTQPDCTTSFDPLTRSAWVSSSGDATFLWCRWSFGNGDLSRSGPSWLARQVNNNEGPRLTSEEVTAKRCAEPKQFKFDHAKAIATAAEAETAFKEQGRVITPGIAPDIRIIPCAGA